MFYFLLAIYNKIKMKKLTQEEFKNKVNIIHVGKVKVLGKYKSSREKIEFECNTCFNKWFSKANSIISGRGCPKCGKLKAKNTKKWNLSTEDFFKRLPLDVQGKITILSEYKSTYESIKVECNKCNKKWETKPVNLKSGYCCSDCGREERNKKTSLTQKEFEDKVYKYHGDSIEVVSNYISGSKEILFLCNNCGKKSKKKTARLLLRRGCSNCIFSKGEKKIQDLLDKNLIKFEREYKIDDLSDIGSLRFDFAIIKGENELSHLIEYDGRQHFESIKYFGGEKRFKDQVKKDKIKNEYCKKNNIRLIRIDYKQFKNIDLKMLLL